MFVISYRRECTTARRYVKRREEDLLIADCGLRIAMLSHRDTETQSRKRKEAFSAISFPLFLCVSVSLWLTAIRNPQSAIRDRLRGRGALLTGAGFLMFFCLIAVLADLLSPYDYS